MQKSTLVFVLLILCRLSTQAGNPGVNVQNFMQGHNKALAFTQNLGQLADENGKLLPDIKYYGSQGGVNIYMRAGRISFVFTKLTEQKDEASAFAKKEMAMPDNFKTPAKTTIEAARMDMDFLGASPSPQIMSEIATETYTNYYFAHTPEEGVTHVASCKKLTYQNIYPNIDLVLLSLNDKLEYEFVVRPGGNIADIQIKWSGAVQMQSAKDGGIHYTNALGQLNESKPTSFTPAGAVGSSFIVKNNIVSFQVAEYNTNETLTIDPTLSWGTYFGGGSYDYGTCIATDVSGNVFMTGQTSSTMGIATTGAFQDTLAGSWDAFLEKFSASGSLSWATYYGGDSDDAGYGVATNDSGNVFITGGTKSSFGIASSGAYQSIKASKGDQDAFLVKFNFTGTRIWGTYFGGRGDDTGYDIAMDDSGNAFITGWTYSIFSIATSGAYQKSLGGGGGDRDAFLAKFGSSGTRIWGTYYGGSAYDGSNKVAVDDSGNVFIIGNTQSTSGISTSGSFQPNFTGSSNAFLAKFKPSGACIWATYFGGSVGETGYGVAVDDSGNVFITGFSQSTSGIITTGAYQSSFGGGKFDAYLAKFSSSGARIWATYYGGSGPEYGICIATDAIGYVFLTGYTGSKSGIATSGAYQTSLAGGKTTGDCFLAKFGPLGTLAYGTYYGGSNDEAGSGVASDAAGNVFIAGYTLSKTNISTSGAYQDSLAGIQDAFLAKFALPSTSINKSTNNLPSAQTLTILPNPFMESAIILYSLNEESNISIELCDMLGRNITLLADAKAQPGNHEIRLEAAKYNLRTGIYFIRLKAGQEVLTKKVIYLE